MEPPQVNPEGRHSTHTYAVVPGEAGKTPDQRGMETKCRAGAEPSGGRPNGRGTSHIVGQLAKLGCRLASSGTEHFPEFIIVL